MKKTASQIGSEVLEKLAISMADLDRIAQVAKTRLVRPPRTSIEGVYAPLHKGRGIVNRLSGEEARLLMPARDLGLDFHRGPQAYTLKDLPQRKVFMRRSTPSSLEDLEEARDIYDRRIARFRRSIPDRADTLARNIQGSERQRSFALQEFEKFRAQDRAKYLRDLDTKREIARLLQKVRPMTPTEQKYRNYLTQAHELDELALERSPQNLRISSHASPDVVFRESNRVATLPPELRQLGVEEQAMRVGRPEWALYERIRAKYPQLGVGRYGENRINRRLRRFLTEEQGAGRLLE